MLSLITKCIKNKVKIRLLYSLRLHIFTSTTACSVPELYISNGAEIERSQYI